MCKGQDVAKKTQEAISFADASAQVKKQLNAARQAARKGTPYATAAGNAVNPASAAEIIGGIYETLKRVDVSAAAAKG